MTKAVGAKTGGGLLGAIGGLAGGLGTLGLAGMGIQTAIGAAVGAVQGLIGPASEAQQVTAQLQSVLASTGGKAGVTEAAVNALSASLSKVTTFEDEAITSAQSLLLTFTNIGQDVFPAATETVLNMSQALGQDLKTSSVQLGKALNDPIQGVGALRRVGVQLTDAQEELVKSLVAVGDTAGAQQIILQELEVEFGGAAKAAGETFAGQLTILQNQFGNVMEVIGGPVLAGLSELMRAVMPLVEAFGEWLPGAMDALLSALQPVFDFIGGYLIPQLTDLGRVVMAVFSGDFQGAVDLLTTSIFPRLEEFGRNVLAWVQEQIPVLIRNLAAWAQAFIEWVAPLIPPLLVELGRLAGELFAWIADQAPVFLKTLIGEWIPAFLGWVLPMIPPLLLELGKVIVAVGKWIVTEGAPELLRFALSMGQAIIEGLLQALAPLGDAVSRELGRLGDNFKRGGAALAEQFKQGFLSIPIVAAVRGVTQQVADLLPHSLAKAGPLSIPTEWADVVLGNIVATTDELLATIEGAMAGVRLELDATGEAFGAMAEAATVAAGEVAGAVARTSEELAALLNARSSVAGIIPTLVWPAAAGGVGAGGGGAGGGGAAAAPGSGVPGGEAAVEHAVQTGSDWHATFNFEKGLGRTDADARAIADAAAAQKRQLGGWVWPGQDFMVGERGPEVVRFGAPGYVYPSGVSPSGVYPHGQGGGRAGGVDLATLAAVIEGAVIRGMAAATVEVPYTKIRAAQQADSRRNGRGW